MDTSETTVPARSSSLEDAQLNILSHQRRSAIPKLPYNVSPLYNEHLQCLIIERRNALQSRTRIECNSKRVRFINV